MNVHFLWNGPCDNALKIARKNNDGDLVKLHSEKSIGLGDNALKISIMSEYKKSYEQHEIFDEHDHPVRTKIFSA